MSVEDEIFSVPQAARFCRLSRGVIWKNVKAGELKAWTTPGGHFRIAKDDLMDFMKRKGIRPVADYQPNPKKVLIVDDDPQVQEVLTRFLSYEGYALEVAEDGFQAGIKIANFKPRLVILDLFLPGLDGFQVCKNIKNNSRTRGIKVLIITGFAEEENKKRIFDLGADGFLEKPLSKERIINEVEKLLCNSSFSERKQEIL